MFVSFRGQTYLLERNHGICRAFEYGLLQSDAWVEPSRLLVMQSVQQERTVPIPRWIAEKMLVERYKDMLTSMSDEDVARLFEQQGVGVKEFPEGLVSDHDDVGSAITDTDRVENTEDSGAAGETEDETAALLMEEQHQDDLVDKGEGGVVSSLSKYVDSKDIALIAMGTGALVLGTSLMYMLISTLSSSASSPSKGEAEGIVDEKSAASVQADDVIEEEGANKSSPDPYTMYSNRTDANGEGGVIWERREEQPVAQQDLWRVPMEDLKSSQNAKRDMPEQREPKRPPTFEDILDNAESISIGKKHRSKNVS